MPDNQPEPRAPAVTCFCVIAHAITPADRERISESIRYAREIGDLQALPLLLLQLTGSCPARP